MSLLITVSSQLENFVEREKGIVKAFNSNLNSCTNMYDPINNVNLNCRSDNVNTN